MAVSITLEQDATPGRQASRASGWDAVFALTLCVATLIASEFMPVSLLTPIPTDLQMTEGRVDAQRRGGVRHRIAPTDSADSTERPSTGWNTLLTSSIKGDRP